jgi:Zn-dependent protease
MRDSIRLGRVLGIPVGIHWSLLVAGGLLTLNLTAGLGRGAASLLVAGLAAALLFASVLAHELGHAVVARRNGTETEGITLWLLGGVARLRGRIRSAGAQLRIALAGPLVSLGLAAAFAAAFLAGSVLGVPALVRTALGWLAIVNVVTAVFNLLPAAPLDGGRVLAAALWARHGDEPRAMLSAAKAGRIVGWGLIGLGAAGVLGVLPVGGLWLALLGWFILSAAAAEARAAIPRTSFAGAGPRLDARERTARGRGV